MVSLAGLSAVYPGYQQAQGKDLQNRSMQLGVQDQENQQAGDIAFGNTLKMFQQQVPGAQPMPGAGGMPGVAPPQMAQNGPQPPMPGQPSAPMQPPGPPPMPIGPQGSQQAQPQMPQPGQPPMQGGGQPGGMPQGQLDWRSIAQKVAQANPGAPPQVIAAAVTKFLPLMNQQAQMEWKNVMMAQQVARTGIQQERADTAKEQGGQRLEQADKRIGQRDVQLEREGNREARLAASAVIRQDQGFQRLDMQRKALEARIQQGGDRQALAQWRAVLDAQHKLAIEKIQSSNFGNTMDAKDKKALLEEQDKIYRAAIEQMRATQGRSTPGQSPAPANPGPKTEERVPQKRWNPQTGALEPIGP